MEIQWGENYIHLERTVPVLIAMAPLVFVIQIPMVFRAIERLFTGTKKKLALKYPGHYGKHRGV